MMLTNLSSIEKASEPRSNKLLRSNLHSSEKSRQKHMKMVVRYTTSCDLKGELLIVNEFISVVKIT